MAPPNHHSNNRTQIAIIETTTTTSKDVSSNVTKDTSHRINAKGVAKNPTMNDHINHRINIHKKQLPVIKISKNVMLRKQKVINRIVRTSTAPRGSITDSDITETAATTAKNIHIHQPALRRPTSRLSAMAVAIEPEDLYNSDEFPIDGEFIISEIDSCETYIAIIALQKSVDTCMCISPLSLSATIVSPRQQPEQQHNFLRGVLECQLLEYFLTKSSKEGAGGRNILHNSRTIRQQIHFLQLQNVIKCIPIHNDLVGSTTYQPLYVLTKDYILYIQQQNVNITLPEQPLLDWWTHQLVSSNWISGGSSNHYIHERHIEAAFHNDPPDISDKSAKEMIQWLQDHQLLLCATASSATSSTSRNQHHSMYQLWLPGTCWGSKVLPSLYQIIKGVLLFIKRSQYHERSLVSIVERFQHKTNDKGTNLIGRKNHLDATLSSVPPQTRRLQDQVSCLPSIPIEAVVIPYMIALGQLQRVERPSGMFLKLA